MLIRLRFSLAILLLAGSLPVAADTFCDNFQSLGNPYPCCSAGGNCTWWAWKEASDFWGLHLPSWGNAKSWVAGAAAAGYYVNPVPAPSTIGVNLTAYDQSLKQIDGHVVWVLAVSADGQTVFVSQMVCGGSGMQTMQYPTSYFTNGGGGFIYPQTHAATPTVTTSNPLFITHSTKSQLITIIGGNLDATKIVYVTTPTGAHIILQGAQIPSITPSHMQVNMTLSTAGRWQVAAIGSNGAHSNTLYLNIE